MSENIVTWNLANWITITIMAVVGLAAVYLVGQGVQLFIHGKTTANVTGGPGSGAPVTDPATGTSTNA